MRVEELFGGSGTGWHAWLVLGGVAGRRGELCNGGKWWLHGMTSEDSSL